MWHYQAAVEQSNGCFGIFASKNGEQLLIIVMDPCHAARAYSGIKL